MIEGAKEVARAPKLDDNVNLARLGAIDTIRLVMSKMTKNEMEELENAEKLSAEKLRRLGSLNSLIETAVDEMNRRKEKSVTLNLSSVYLPYVDECMDTKTGWGRFYDIDIQKRNIPANVKHYFLCIIRKREIAPKH